MVRSKYLKRKVFLIIILFMAIIFISYFIFSMFKVPSPNTVINKTTTTKPYQENVSIEVPEGVTKIGKRGKIQIVE